MYNNKEINNNICNTVTLHINPLLGISVAIPIPIGGIRITNNGDGIYYSAE